jgi:hypothetical protein
MANENMNETAIVGAGRPATSEHFEAVSRQRSGLPPRGARDLPATLAAPDGAPLPFLGVSRQALGRHIGELAAEAAKIERDLSRGMGIGVTGQQLPHLIDQRRQLENGLLSLREEIERLGGLDDGQVQHWAAEHGRLLYR